MSRQPRLAPALLALALFAVVGCQSPFHALTAPDPWASQAMPPAPADHTSAGRVRPSPTPEPTDEPPGQPDVLPTAVPPGPAPLSAPGPITSFGVVRPDLLPLVTLLMPPVTAVIDGSQGGRIENDRVRLDIPSGAFSGKATITMTMSDPVNFVVNLDIQPASANHFNKPVEMRMNCNGLPWTRTPATYWYNPVDKRWYGMTQSEFNGDEIRVFLSHFSTYGAGGKAGW
ncbi:MAG TPA: hypothetical protein VI504_05760 [Candidatus Eisenbacteria bacterium]|jgi:hypothetical protein